MPLSHSGDTLSAHLPQKIRGFADIIISLILIALLVLTLIYFMPQFPQYAVNPYAYFVI